MPDDPSHSESSQIVAGESAFWNAFMSRGQFTSGVVPGPYPGLGGYFHTFHVGPNDGNADATAQRFSSSQSRTPPAHQTTPVQYWYPWLHASSQPHHYVPQPGSGSTSQLVPTPQVQSTPSTSSIHTPVQQSVSTSQTPPAPQAQTPSPSSPGSTPHPVPTPQIESNASISSIPTPLQQPVWTPQIDPALLGQTLSTYSNHSQVPQPQPSSIAQLVPTPQAQSTSSTSTKRKRAPKRQPVSMPQPPQVQSTLSTSSMHSPQLLSTHATASTSGTPLSQPMSLPSSSLDPLLNPLIVLQSQLTTLQGDCGTIKSDIKSALTAITTVCNKQAQTDKRINALEDAIGIDLGCTSTPAKPRARRGKRTKRLEPGTSTAEPTPEVGASADLQEIPTLIYSLACIQSSIDKLLNRENAIPQSHPPVIYREVAISPPPSPAPTPPMELDSETLPSANLPTAQLPLSSVVIHSPDPQTSSSPTTPEKSFTDVSIQACPPPSESSCAFASQRRNLSFTPVNWSTDLLTHPRFTGGLARSSAYAAEYMTRFVWDSGRDADTDREHDHGLSNRTNGDVVTRSLDERVRGSAETGDSESDMVTVDDLRRSVSTVGLTRTRTRTPAQTRTGTGTWTRTRGPTRTMSAPNLVSQSFEDGRSSEDLGGAAKVTLVTSASYDGLPGDSIGRDDGMVSSLSMTRGSGSGFEADPMETLEGPEPETEQVLEPEPELGPELEMEPEPQDEDDRMITDPESDQAPRITHTIERDIERDTSASSAIERDESGSPAIERDMSASPAMDEVGDDIVEDGGDEACPSGLPTPPSDRPSPSPSPGPSVTTNITANTTANADAVDTHWTGEPGSESGSVVCPNPIPARMVSRNFPVIPTPPCVTPPPSSGEGDGDGEDMQSQGYEVHQRLGEQVSPLTPPPPSPFVGRQGRVVDGGEGEGEGEGAGGGGETGKGDVVDAVVDEAGAWGKHALHSRTTSEATSPQSDPAARSTAAPSSPSNEIAKPTVSAIPAIMITHASLSTIPSYGDADSQAADDHDVSSFVTPNSSPDLPDIDLPGLPPGFSIVDSLRGRLYEYDLELRSHDGLGSPALHPSHSTSTATSRYQTPSDTHSHPTQDEDEVWDTLMLGPSGMSTPGSVFMYSGYPSRAMSVHPQASLSSHQHQEGHEGEGGQQMLSIDPSILYAPRSMPPPDSSPHFSERSLSPLTSLDETDPEDHAHFQSRTTNSSTHVHSRTHLANAGNNRRSEPYYGPFEAHLRPFGSLPPTSTRAVSEMSSLSGSGRSGSRLLGGPSASLEELMMLARRQPLKIHVKVPETMRGVKRKWGDVERVSDKGGREMHEENNGEGRGDHGEDVRAGAGLTVSGLVALQSGELSVLTALSDEPIPANVGVALSTPAPTPPASSAPGHATDLPATHTVNDDPSMHSLQDVPRKKTKHASQDNNTNEALAAPEKPKRVRSRQKKYRKDVKAKSTSYSAYYIHNGEVVMAEPESRPAPSVSFAPAPPAPAPPSAPPTDEAPESSTRHNRPRRDSVNHAMKTPPSSPVRPVRSNARSPRRMKQSPTKEDIWSAIAIGDGTWPTLPTSFTRWDEQFIQCDNCDMWYHYGCVGIEADDPRLENGQLFICPTCHIKSARRKTLRKHEGSCARPDCPEPVGNEDLYFVQKLVGRKRIENGDYLWLAKWEGYPMSQASWIPKENVVTGGRMFEVFEEEALEEGLDLSKDVVLLEEAVEAGWEKHAGDLQA